MEREEAEHERDQDDDYHLHRLLFRMAARQDPPLPPGSPLGPPTGLQELPYHEPIAHHDNHEWQGEHEDGYDRTVHQEVIEKLWAGGVVADPGRVPIPEKVKINDVNSLKTNSVETSLFK